MKKAFISGINGQDASYLTELLLEKGYEVHGIVRRASVFNTERIDHLIEDKDIFNKKLFVHYGDMTDSSNLNRLLKQIEPDEIYHLAAQSHVKVSFEVPEYTADVVALGTLRLLDALRASELDTKFYQASTSELYGGVTNQPMNEEYPFYPRSPYAVAKLYGYYITINYREAYNLHASNGILFNHESPRRGKRFVTKKITRAVARINAGLQDKIYLGNLNAQRDWGYAKEFVECMWRILQQDKPDDYVVATGELHSIREFVEESFKFIDVNIDWVGKGLKEKGVDSRTKKTLVEVDERYFRPTETETLCGDASKAYMRLGWYPKTKFKDLVRIMMEDDLGELK